jgi:hypothetical protein
VLGSCVMMADGGFHFHSHFSHFVKLFSFLIFLTSFRLALLLFNFFFPSVFLPSGGGVVVVRTHPGVVL